jgi:hypothetical protein
VAVDDMVQGDCAPSTFDPDFVPLDQREGLHEQPPKEEVERLIGARLLVFSHHLALR